MIIFNSSKTMINNFKLLEIGKSDDNVSNGWGPGMRDTFLIHFCYAGEGVFNGQKITKGMYFLSEPFTKINYHQSKDNPWKYVWFIFYGQGSIDFLSSFNIDYTISVGKFSFADRLSFLVDYIFTQDAMAVNDEKMFNIASIILSQNKENSIETKENVDHVSRAKQYIDTHYHSGISPKDVADFVNLDKKYLCSLFRKNCQISTQEYINQVRIEKAKSLLQLSNLNISEISYSVGIADPLNFSRFFRKIVGLSPRDYRKQCIKN